MASPTMTFNAEGDIRSAATLAAGATADYDIDVSTKIETQIVVEHNAGGTVATTRGLRVRCYPRYGTAPSTSRTARPDVTIGVEASTPNSDTFWLGTGKWRISVTNLDTTNGLSGVAITSATVNGIA